MGYNMLPFCSSICYNQKNKLEFVEVAKMKLKNPMLVVTDIDKSVEFYKKVFGLHVIMDFGANRLYREKQDFFWWQ